MKTYLKIAALTLAGFGTGYLLRKAFARKTPETLPEWDTQFAGNAPRYTGAISAVTGGPPEDMNGMPATTSINGPIWDGSQL